MNAHIKSVVPPNRRGKTVTCVRTERRKGHGTPTQKRKHRIATSRRFSNSNGNCACRHKAVLVCSLKSVACLNSCQTSKFKAPAAKGFQVIMETQSRSPIALMCRQGKEGRCDSATLVGWCWCPFQRKKSSTPRKKKKKRSRSGFVTKRQRPVTFRHPQPATNVPMNCSLASNVVSS